MSLWQRLRRLGPRAARERSARAAEHEGRYEQAAELFGQGDDAARCLGLAAGAERDLARRLALLDRAALAAKSPDRRRDAEQRAATLRFDLVRAHGRLARGELALAAEELSRVGLGELAAEAYRLAGDREGEVRALRAAGAIDDLEDRRREEATR